jgi:DNA-directed RNA polymerase specialized sigma24 family protein
MIYFSDLLGMNQAQERLITAVQDLRKRVYSSFPWGLRVARLLFEIRYGAEPAAFGRLTYGLFMLYGVLGLPRVDVVPKTIRDIDKLPRDFGNEFGFKCRNTAAKYLRFADEIEELLSSLVVKLISSDSVRKALDGEQLHRAESYVLTMIRHSAIEKLRSDKVRRHEDIAELIEEPSPHWDQLGHILTEREKDQLSIELEKAVSRRLLPDLPLYFQLMMEGYSNAEVAEQRMLPSLKEKPISQQALAKYRAKLKEVLERHFEVRSASLCYW